jgi:predicted ATPase/DNA-binding SARP family transcriptional activator
MMWTLQLLGGLSAYSQDRKLTRFRTQKAASLLAYLACRPVPHPRETLIAMLWPDAEPDAGRHNLNNALSFLRHRLEPPGVPPGTVVLADRFTVQLNPETATSDVVSFESFVRQAGRPGISETERLSLLQKAADLYQGPLLPGFYEEWIGPEALRLENLFAHVVGQLAPLLLQVGRYEQALEYAQRAHRADPLSEQAVRQVMQALIALRQSGQALRAYRAFAHRLREELGAQPSEALQSLAAQLGQTGAFSLTLPLTESAAGVEVAGERASFRITSPPARVTESEMPDLQARLLGNAFLLRTNTRFFDREEEVARLSEMLLSPRTRLVTLMGPGGIGKTRLALETAACLVENPEAVARAPLSAVFVPLADITEADRLFEVALRTMGVLLVGGVTPLEQLVTALASQPSTLLILDNFEHLVDAGALLVQELLARIANMKLLITSRQKLDLDGERAFHLPALPTVEGSQSPEALLQVAGIALFVDRAQAARPDFQLTERNGLAVAQLCDRLEGIPLALELAAARVAILAPAKILEQIESNRLDFLATHRRSAASRQRTLRATLDWSYALLPPTGKAFLMQLSAFRGGWTLEAAEAVCEVKQGETPELLMLLRDSSLIDVIDTQDGVRFTMLETVREYSREKLQESGESDHVSRRHCDFYLALAEAAEPQLMGSEQAFWLSLLETEHENLRAALAWCKKVGGEAGLRLAAALWRFWWVRGHWSAARTYLAEALEQMGTGEGKPIRAKALSGAGVLAHSQGAYTSAAAAFEECLSIYRELGDRGGMAAALNGLGSVAQFLGDNAAARRHHEECLSLYRELEDQEAIALSLSLLGNVAVNCGQYDLARRQFEEALAIRRVLGNKRGVGDSLRSLALTAKERGDYGQAREFYEQSVTLYRELGDRSRMAVSRHLLGVVAEHEGDLAGARAIYEECLGIFQEVGDRSQVAWTLHGLGYLALRQADVGAARSLLAQSLSMFLDMAHTIGLLRSLDRFAGLAAAQGQMLRAVRLLGAAAAQRDARGVQSAASEQEENKSYETAARSALRPKEFAEEWEAGQALTIEQAIEYALAF